MPTFRKPVDEHSAILLTNHSVNDTQHIALAQLFGEIEGRTPDKRDPKETLSVPEVSNMCTYGSLTGESDLHTIHLKSDMLWHADSTFLPRPAQTNILISRVTLPNGGTTKLAATRAARADMPKGLKERIRGRGIWHKYSHSGARISEDLTKLTMFHKWPDQQWSLIWTNPANGKAALYVASHAFAVDGYEETAAADLVDTLIELCTQDKYVYSHQWQKGDILIWDQRAALRRGTPSPYDKPHKPSSICVTVRDEDGLESMRVKNDLAI